MQTVSPEAVEWAARRSKDMHEEVSTDRAVGRCKQCTPSGFCPQYAWARRYLESVDELATRSPGSTFRQPSI